MVAVRAHVLATFDDVDAVRDHGRRIRAHTIAHLDRYLAEFADRIEALGGRVHWAETATAARAIVLDLARTRGVRTIVKSKSMVTEELELNPALEEAGMRVIETDLGEYVAQLAHEAPSHIIAPILHKTRGDVAALFREKLGAREDEVADPAQMTDFVRRKLRPEFLRAEMGISGANFGVAATGTLVLVTNEGNGRLCTSAPRVHVAMMGIERVVPTVDDLGVMINLLARSATGQKLSVYTSLITGPRRRDSTGASIDPDGPEELHVVLVDNGRSQMLGGELAEILYCIRCGACLNACPVYQQIGGHAYGTVYQGPVGSVVTPGMYGLGPWSDLPHASTLCGACREVCPVRIDIPRMLLALRRTATSEGLAPAWLKVGMPMYRHMATRPAMYRGIRWLSSRIAALEARGGWIARLRGPLSGWTRYRDFPQPARESFTARWRRERRS